MESIADSLLRGVGMGMFFAMVYGVYLLWQRAKK